MDLEFNQVNYDGDLEDASEEELRSTVEEFEAAQEANAAEFEAAKETLEEVEDVDVADFNDARTDLIESIQEFDSFEESPIGEGELEEAGFAKLREYHAYFADLDASDEGPEEDEGAEFGDMGTRAPVDDGDETPDFAEDIIGSISGVNL